jgi:GDP-L-fucose synthase
MNPRILITGGSGLLGNALKTLLPEAMAVSSLDYDLRRIEEVHNLFQDFQPEYVYHLAAKVGGIKDNSENNGIFFRDNLLINTNVLEKSREFHVKKVCSTLSTCIYPDKTTYPLRESVIHHGEPHNSNFGYAYAKRMLEVQSRAYREQWGCNFICAIPNNLYGKHDNFHLERSHVIPALIRKIYEAKLKNSNVILWGDGSPLREFTFADDAARALVVLMNNYDRKNPINIGNTEEISIKNLAHVICNVLEYDEENIHWDTSYPNGQQKKPSCNSPFLEIDDFIYTSLEEGIKTTCNWFVNRYPTVRGII